MIKFENVEVVGWEHAIRGMRNAKNSWWRSDSYWNYVSCGDCNGNSSCVDGFHIGPNDHSLMMTLRNAGTDHRKLMRMITVYVDITAPLYWWKEFDTYKVGTVANSCSTMHKIHAKEFTMDDFSTEHLSEHSKAYFKELIDLLNFYREDFNNPEADGDPKNKTFYWWQMIQLLPTSYNQRRTVQLNYEVLANMYKSRKGHKIDEWRALCSWVETLPYSELITGEIKENVK